jgi:hypothetical protein
MFIQQRFAGFALERGKADCFGRIPFHYILDPGITEVTVSIKKQNRHHCFDLSILFSGKITIPVETLQRSGIKCVSSNLVLKSRFKG